MAFYSRKIIAWELHAYEVSDLATMVRRAFLVEGIVAQPLVLHSDNGSTMEGTSIIAGPHWRCGWPGNVYSKTISDGICRTQLGIQMYDISE